MAELNNIEQPLNNNTQEPNTNNIPEFYQNNFQNQANNLAPYQNNTQRQINFPESHQNNFQHAYQNNNQGLSQNNNPGPIQNNIHLNGNERINKKMKSLKTIFLIILVIIFISEIVVDFIALPTFSKKKPHAEDEDYYFGEGLKVFAFLFFYYPILIILSSIILWLSCYEDYPIIKIVASIIMCFIRGYIISRFINDYNDKTEIFTIVLLIFNCIFMITSISYQIIIKINLKLSC